MTTSKKIIFAIVICIVLLFVASRWYKLIAAAHIKQPVEYSHKIHTELLKCEECHMGVLTSASATIPGITICKECHMGDKPLSTSPEEIKLQKYIRADEDIPWKRLYKNPVHVYFSHSRHVAVGKIACEKCHGNIGKMMAPPPGALVNMDMGRCIECHDEHNIDTSCITCHK